MIVRKANTCSRGLGDTPSASSATDLLNTAKGWISSQPWYIVAALAAAVAWQFHGKGRR